MPYVESVNVGTAVDVPWGQLKRTGIDKRPIDGSIHIHSLGVGHDEVADQVNHGGEMQAVYVYSREDLDTWAGELGCVLRPGQFGENLTTCGIEVNAVHGGDRWRIGGALLEVAGVRIPCSVFQGFLDEPQWVKRFTAGRLPGAYLRVIEEGAVTAGDRIEIVEERDHEITIDFLFRALTTERHLIPALAAEPRLEPFVLRRLGERPQASHI